MRSEAEVRDQNKRLRRHTQTANLFHFHLTRTQEFLLYVYMFSIDERESENGTQTLFVVCLYHAVCSSSLGV